LTVSQSVKKGGGSDCSCTAKPPEQHLQCLRHPPPRPPTHLPLRRPSAQ
jgi:hypothetical protein